jgi:hypothetical protein
MIDIPRLKEAIRTNIRRLAEALYPNGKFRYAEWRVGNVAGDPGDSLGIRLVGSKKGLWLDRASGEGGNFIDLAKAKFGFGFREAAEWIGRTLGVSFEISEQTEEEAGEKNTVCEVEPEEKSLRPPEPEPEPVPLSGEELKRMALAAHVLSREPRLFYTVLGQRPEISLDTIRGVALEGDLGFELHCGGYDLYGEGTGWITAPAVLFGFLRTQSALPNRGREERQKDSSHALGHWQTYQAVLAPKFTSKRSPQRLYLRRRNRCALGAVCRS